jgi:hypothetical protein
MSIPTSVKVQPGIKQSSALPFSGPGAAQLNNTSIMLAGLQIQQAEDSKFDPQVKTGTYSVVKQGFCSNSIPYPAALMTVGVLCIVYGIIAK